MAIFNKKNFPVWFILISLLFISHQIIQKCLGIDITIFNNYLDPLLCTPILLHLYALEKRILFKNKEYRNSYGTVVIITLFVCVTSEVVFPYFSKKFTSDIWDVLFILIGSIFYILISKNLKKNQ